MIKGRQRPFFGGGVLTAERLPGCDLAAWPRRGGMHATGDRSGQGVRRQRADLQHRQFAAALNLALPGGHYSHIISGSYL